MPQTRYRNRRGRKSGNKGRRRLTGTVSRRVNYGDVDTSSINPSRAIMSQLFHELTHPHSASANYFRKMQQRGRTSSNTPAKKKAGKKKLNKKRHEKLKGNDASGPINKGKGFGKKGRKCYTHPKSTLPKWKIEREKEYSKGDVWQTVLISRAGRLADGTNLSRIEDSNNVLKTFRYPIKAPECLDSERVQSMIFSPFCSHYSGVHTCFYRKVRDDGTDIEHDTATPLDVIQRKADVQRHSLPRAVEGTLGTEIAYEHAIAGSGVVTAAYTQTDTQIANVHAYYDQLMKNIKIDLVFMASRAFPVRISVSLIRHIQPTAPYTWTDDDKKQLLNNLDNKGLEWNNYKVEYTHEFTLPALKMNKPPPTVNVVKDIKTHFMQTNTFNENNAADEMDSASLNLLGSGLRQKAGEVADGFVSGMCYVLIKYRKVQQPQQFTYTHVIESDAVGEPSAQVTLPVLSENSFDVPTLPGSYTSFGGSPLNTSQGDEGKASFYVHGTLKYNWGFREDTEAVPSIMAENPDQANYQKTQSLNIDPTLSGDNNNGIYTQSGSHETRAV